MSDSFKEKKQFQLETAFFLLYFILGALIFKDYGISWDENISRIDCGKINFDFISERSDLLILSSTEKYHGPFFEIILYSLEHAFQLDDLRDVFLFRHLCTFFIFFLSSIYLYKIIVNLTKDYGIALLTLLLFILSPRIFADSFYNSKDIIFLSFFTFSIYTSLMCIEKKTFTSILLHAIVCAICVSVRITGIFIVVVSLIFLILSSVQAPKENNIARKLTFKSLAFILLFLTFTTLFWPVLWLGPIKHLILAFKEMSSFHWNGVVLFKGNWVSAEKLPWDYIPVWIGITTPIIYLVFFVIGIYSIIKILLINKFKVILKNLNLLFILACFFGPIISVIVLHSVVYDGWRHLYFVYPAMIIVIAFGLKFIQSLISTKTKALKARIITIILVFTSIIPVAQFMITFHPYQNLYFNSFISDDVNVIRKNYELDYWGLTYKEALETIVTKDKSQFIKINSQHYSGEINSFMLSKADRKRLVFVQSKENADYYINNYRDFTEASLDKKLAIVTRNGNEYCYIIKLKK